MSGLLDDILAVLQVVERKPNGQILCWCPLHPDGQGNPPHKPNMEIKPGNKAAYIWACPVCNTGGTLLQLANRLREIGAMPPRDGHRSDENILASYDYRDGHGALLYQVVRLCGKVFPQRRKGIKGEWVWNLDGVRRVPYRLPELLAADVAQWVYIPEGEKDCDNLALLGLVASTNSGGAGKWRGEFGSYFRGRKVAILPDFDAPGEAHGQDVARKLAAYATEIRIVNLPDLPTGGDVSDWLGQGHTAAELAELVEATPIYVLPSDTGDTLGDPVSGPDMGKSATATLADVEEAFGKWLLMPDMGGLHFALAILAGHRIGGDATSNRPFEWGLRDKIADLLAAVEGAYTNA